MNEHNKRTLELAEAWCCAHGVEADAKTHAALVAHLEASESPAGRVLSDAATRLISEDVRVLQELMKTGGPAWPLHYNRLVDFVASLAAPTPGKELLG